MPLRLESARASSKIRRLASRRGPRQLLLGRPRRRGRSSNDVRGDPRSHLARLRTAHAVRDHEHRRAREIGVLVGVALPARVGARRLFDDSQHARSAGNSCLEPELGVADPDPVVRPQQLRRCDARGRSGRCRSWSSCPRGTRARHGRRRARGGRMRSCRRSRTSLAGARPIVGPIRSRTHSPAAQTAATLLDDQPRPRLACRRRIRRRPPGRQSGTGRRRSRSALRTTHSRNRYSTARKANLSRTSIGSVI